MGKNWKWGECEIAPLEKQSQASKILAMPPDRAHTGWDKPFGVFTSFPAWYILRLAAVAEKIDLRCVWHQLNKVLWTLTNTKPAPVAFFIAYNGYILVIIYGYGSLGAYCDAVSKHDAGVGAPFIAQASLELNPGVLATLHIQWFPSHPTLPLKPILNEKCHPSANCHLQFAQLLDTQAWIPKWHGCLWCYPSVVTIILSTRKIVAPLSWGSNSITTILKALFSEMNDSVPWGYESLKNSPRSVADPTAAASVESI